MSRINELITEIRTFLAADDQTLRPGLRRLAAEYAAAVKGVAAELNECRSLIAHGLLRDACALARRDEPDLIERVSILNFPGVERWRELCSSYGLEVPPELDIATVARLSGAVSPDERTLAELIVEWRRIARSGGVCERLGLLRKIVELTPPEGRRQWQSSLMELEKSRLAEIEHAGEAAAASGDFDRLEALNLELAAPGWAVEPPRELRERLSALLAPELKRRFERRVEEQLAKIAAAFAAMDAEGVRSRLAEWEALATEPGAEIPPDALQQVAEARRWLEGVDAEQRKEEEFRELRSRLIRQFDDGAAFPEINRTYQSLKLIGLPLDESGALDRRYEVLAAAAQREASRRHIRNLVYGIAAALVIGATATILIWYNQYSGQVEATAAELQELIDAGNYAAALELCDGLERESSAVATAPAIVALRGEAVAGNARLEQRNRDDLAQLARLEERLPNLREDEAAEFTAALDELRPRLTGDGAARAEALRLGVAEMLRLRQEERDNAFSAACDQAVAGLNALFSAIQGEELPAESAVSAALNGARQLISGASQVSQTVVDTRRVELELLGGKVEVAFKEAQRRRELEAAIDTPENWSDALEALRRIPVEAPDLATRYAAAVAAMPRYAALLENLGGVDNFRDREKFRQMFEHNQGLHPGIWQQDLAFGAPLDIRDPAAATALRDKFAEFIRLTSSDSDFYETVFRDNKKRPYYFYTAVEPTCERRSGFNTLRAVDFALRLRAGGDERHVVLTVRQDAAGGAWFLLNPANNHSGFELPDSFSAPDSWNGRDIVFRKSAHFRFLSDMLKELEAAGSFSEVEQVLAQRLNGIVGAGEMNPFARLYITVNLMKLLRECSPFYQPLDRVIAELEGISGLRNILSPVEVAQNEELVKKIDAALGAVDVGAIIRDRNYNERLFQQVLQREVIAAGIIHENSDGRLVIHSFTDELPPELYVLTDASGAGLERLTRLPDVAAGEAFPESVSGRLFPGEMVFGFRDRLDTGAFYAKLAQEAERAGARILRRPRLCPEGVAFEVAGQ